MLSSIYIDTPEYGTGFKTVMLVDKNREVQFHEERYYKDGWKQNKSIFNLEQGIV